MGYEINVSLNGQHFFATNERSCTNDYDLKRVYDVFKDKFPKSEGYEISVSLWKKTGKIINMEANNNEN